MESLTFPSATLLYNSVIIAIVVTVVAGVIIKVAEGKIPYTRAITFILATIAFALVFYWVIFTGISDLLVKIGHTQEKQTGCPLAVTSYKKAVQWNRNNQEALVNYTECMITLNRAKEAMMFLLAMQDTQSDNWSFWYALARLYMATDDYANLSSALTKMLDLNPQTSYLAVNIGYYYHTKLRYADAEAILRNAIYHNDSDNEAIFWIAWSLYEQDKFDDAMYHFDECLKRFSEGFPLARCHAGKGFIYRDLQQEGKAIAEFSLAIQIYPDQKDVQNALDELIP